MTLPLRLRAGAPCSRDAVVRHLEGAGIETRQLIAGNLARHPAVGQVAHRIAEPMTVCDELLREAFMIGCHPVLSPGSLKALELGVKSLARL